MVHNSDLVTVFIGDYPVRHSFPHGLFLNLAKELIWSKEARCSSVIRALARDVMGRWISP